MDLHRRTRLRSLRYVLGGGALVLVLGLVTDWVEPLLYGSLLLLAGIVWGMVKLVRALAPFRFSIGPSGLDVRHRGLARLVRWNEIESMQLCPSAAEEPPYLLLIPATSADLGRPLDATSPVDRRAGLRLLDLETIMESPDQVAEALVRYSGGRFQDMRRFGLPPGPPFAVAGRGYDRGQVDDLVRRAQEALASDSPNQRAAVRMDLTGPDFSIGLRGYDRQQVDRYLAQLDAQLAEHPAAPDVPE